MMPIMPPLLGDAAIESWDQRDLGRQLEADHPAHCFAVGQAGIPLVGLGLKALYDLGAEESGGEILPAAACTRQSIQQTCSRLIGMD